MNVSMRNQPRAIMAGGETLAFWTLATVKQRLHEMGRTLKRLPGSNVWIADLAGGVIYDGRGLPERVRTWQERFLERLGEEELHDDAAPAVTRLRPLPADITRMDQCINWFQLLPTVDQRRAVWAWALGIGARRLGRRLGVSKDQAHRLTMNAMEELVVALNRGARV